ncbi:MAG: SIR2 family protein [Pyrinomonadaceae bacterium]
MRETQPYKFDRHEPLEDFTQYIETLNDSHNFLPLPEVEKPVKAHLLAHLHKLHTDLESGVAKLESYSSFLAPRLVKASRDGSLVPFLGAGISLAAGIPTWGSLLDTLGLASDYTTDPHVEHDALTQAELIAHELGTDVLQQKLRAQMGIATDPALAHYLLAALCLPVYITTNYDGLFELAWERMWKDKAYRKLIVIKNDVDVTEYGLGECDSFPTRGRSLLIKLHGDSTSNTEHMILTRSDYRRHYRSNADFFDVVKRVMRSGCVLFLGFGHRDPEILRLVEDIVYAYEDVSRLGREETLERSEPVKAPNLYSVQFDMRQRTAEAFAARGIVALRPPAVVTGLSPNQLRSASLAVELGELMAAVDHDEHNAIDLNERLRMCVDALTGDLKAAMDKLKARKDRAAALLKEGDEDGLRGLLGEMLGELGPTGLAGQGAYVTYGNGNVAAMAVPEGLNADARNKNRNDPRKPINFGERPYFRQAKTFRSAFVSDVHPSVYNGHSTIFLCMPLGEEKDWTGLMFVAAQPGAWKLPLALRHKCLRDGVEFMLVDSNGIVIVPLTKELRPTPAPSPTLPEGESPKSNLGFPYKRIQEMSRRDRHILHVVQQVVPVGWDDDVHDVAPDLRLYSMVADVRGTRWKIALSRPVPSTLAKNA